MVATHVHNYPYEQSQVNITEYSLDHPAVDVPEQAHPGTLPKPDLLQKKFQEHY